VGGWFLDRWLGTRPILTIVLVVLCLVGMFARMWYAYEAQMQAHDAAAPWGRPAGESGAGVAGGGPS